MSAPHSRSLPQIPGFEVIDRIGFGGFATVYRARQPGLDRTVAIKVVHRTRGANDDTLRRFRRECQAIGSLTGTPAVMTVFDLGTTVDGDPYLVLEYLDGGSLQEQLEVEGIFDWSEVASIGRDLGIALHAAHELGILHRDIKPANVLRDRFGNVRLGDFGIAHLAGSSESTTGDTAMTISYAAPEMLMGKRATDASDVYSLGALMYTLLRGRPPYSRPDDNSVAAVILRITSEPVPPLPSDVVPAPLFALIQAVMAKEPSERLLLPELVEKLEAISDRSERSRFSASNGGARVERIDHDRTRLPDKPREAHQSERSKIEPSSNPLDPSVDVSQTPLRRKGPSFSSMTVNRARDLSGRAEPSAPTGEIRSTLRTSRGSNPATSISAVQDGGMSGPLGRAVFDSGPGRRGVHGGLGYAVDVVFVIDTTASMWPVLAQVKRNALGFHDRLLRTMSIKGKHVSKLRVRVVAYRDFLDCADDALFATPFFVLPDQERDYNAMVVALAADGGGDEPESGLEALAVAMQSPWERGMDRRRQVIVVCTDASGHPLEAAVRRRPAGYPAGIPNDFDGLTDAWGDTDGGALDYAAKRLLLYAPDVYPWNLISQYWDSVLHFPSAAGQGLSEVDFTQIVDAIAGSI